MVGAGVGADSKKDPAKTGANRGPMLRGPIHMTIDAFAGGC